MSDYNDDCPEYDDSDIEPPPCSECDQELNDENVCEDPECDMFEEIQDQGESESFARLAK